MLCVCLEMLRMWPPGLSDTPQLQQASMGCVERQQATACFQCLSHLVTLQSQLRGLGERSLVQSQRGQHEIWITQYANQLSCFHTCVDGCQPNKMMSVLPQPVSTDFIFQVCTLGQERATRHACRYWGIALLGSPTNSVLAAICASHVGKAAMPATLCLVSCKECWCVRGASLNASSSSSIKSGKVLMSKARLRTHFCAYIGMVDVRFVLRESSRPTIPAFQGSDELPSDKLC